MKELYFGNWLSVVSILSVICLWAFAITMMARNKKIAKWGRWVAVIALCGLIVCIFVALRDDYVKSVQATTSGGESGLFAAKGVQSTLCSIGGGIIAVASLSSIFVKKQQYRKAMFFVISAVMMVKTLIIEISRIVLIGG